MTRHTHVPKVSMEMAPAHRNSFAVRKSENSMGSDVGTLDRITRWRVLVFINLSNLEDLPSEYIISGVPYWGLLH